MQWESNSPVSFQYFHNFGFKGRTHTVVCWKCLQFGKIIWDRLIPHYKTPQEIRNQQFIKSYKFQPVVKHESCTLMMLHNLAHPEWVQVGCNMRLFHNVYCVVKTLVEHRSGCINDYVACPTTCLLQTNICIGFHWLDKMQGVSTHHCDRNTMFHNEEMFSFLYKAVKHVLPPFLYNFSPQNGSVQRFQYNRFLNLFQHKTDIVHFSQAQGFYLCIETRLKQKVGGNIKLCGEMLFVSSLTHCHTIPQHWQKDNDSFLRENESEIHKEHGTAQVCVNLYFLERTNICLHYKVQEEKIKYEATNFFCNDGSQLHIILKDDLVADCGSTAEDELHLQALLTSNKATNCEHPFQIPCRTGHSKCYNITEVCSYSLDEYHHLHPCRTGDHLESCINFECTLTFKCTISYCIQWSSICDGKWDCPDGDDERGQPCTDADRCRNMFKCQGPGQTCIPLGNVCDNKKDCLSNDDEHLCVLAGISCPGDCQCQTFSLFCGNVSLVQTFTKYPYLSVYFSHIHTHFSILYNLGLFFPSAISATLQYCSLHVVCQSTFPNNVVSIDFSFNHLSVLDKNCFKTINKVQYLSFNHNAIQFLNSSTFALLLNLAYLSLSNNPLSNVQSQSFSNLTMLSILNLKNISVNQIERNALFQLPNLQVVWSSDFLVCCATPSKTKCTETLPWYLSCFGHLRNKILMFCFLLAGFAILFVNLLSCGMHFAFKRRQKVFFVIVISINANYVLLSLYYFVMWIVDLSHDTSFVLNDAQWRSSEICFTIFSVSWTTVFLSPILLTLMSLTRLMVVVHPLHTVFLRYRFVTRVIVVSAFFCSVFALCFTLLIKLLEKMFPFSLCSPFVDPTDKIVLIKVTLWCCFFTQFLSSVAEVINHSLLVVNYKASQRKLGKKHSKDKRLNVAPLAIMTVSNVLCWVSANSILVSVSFLQQYPIDLVFWTVGMVLPLNSLLVPSVFLTGFIRKKNSI